MANAAECEVSAVVRCCCCYLHVGTRESAKLLPNHAGGRARGEDWKMYLASALTETTGANREFLRGGLYG